VIPFITKPPIVAGKLEYVGFDTTQLSALGVFIVLVKGWR
jgi:hypothetical protein